MIIAMQLGATPEQVEAVKARIGEFGLESLVFDGSERTVIGVKGTAFGPELMESLQLFPGVEDVTRVTKPYKQASREFKSENTIVNVGDLRIGADELVIMAGPCSVESRDQMIATARSVKAAGARMLRGGAFKPRTSPYSFQGLGEEGLEFLAEARTETGLPIITEVMAPEDVSLVARYTDVLQVGARNMQNFPLLREVGRSHRPVLLKRGLAGTLEEWLMAAEYILNAGNEQLMLCERGIRTFEPWLRNTFDLAAIPYIKRLSHLPVIADPSHATGKWYLVKPMAMAAAAAGADGLIIEVHPSPDHALSDGPQSLNFENFSGLMDSMRALVPAVGRTLPAAQPETAVAKL
jgi:3-deoxy-7-phosphoheptulonate synthase